MLKLKLQYFGHLKKNRLNGKDYNSGKHCGHEDKRATEDERVVLHHQLNGDGFSRRKLLEIVKDREAWFASVHEVANSRT